MHCHGWRSVYCMPKRPAFKGSAPINLTDRLHQVLRWALGSVEIFLSKHCPIWYGYRCGLKPLERLSYINSVIYPWTSIPLLIYCALPAFCLLSGKFMVPEVLHETIISLYATLLVGFVDRFIDDDIYFSFPSTDEYLFEHIVHSSICLHSSYQHP